MAQILRFGDHFSSNCINPSDAGRQSQAPPGRAEIVIEAFAETARDEQLNVALRDAREIDRQVPERAMLDDPPTGSPAKPLSGLPSNVTQSGRMRSTMPKTASWTAARKTENRKPARTSVLEQIATAGRLSRERRTLTQCFIPNKISDRQNTAIPVKEVALRGQNHYTLTQI